MLVFKTLQLHIPTLVYQRYLKNLVLFTQITAAKQINEGILTNEQMKACLENNNN